RRRGSGEGMASPRVIRDAPDSRPGLGDDPTTNVRPHLTIVKGRPEGKGVGLGGWGIANVGGVAHRRGWVGGETLSGQAQGSARLGVDGIEGLFAVDAAVEVGVVGLVIREDRDGVLVEDLLADL